jgi:hypothetical protein
VHASLLGWRPKPASIKPDILSKLPYISAAGAILASDELSLSELMVSTGADDISRGLQRRVSALFNVARTGSTCAANSALISGSFARATVEHWLWYSVNEHFVHFGHGLGAEERQQQSYRGVLPLPRMIDCQHVRNSAQG